MGRLFRLIGENFAGRGDRKEFWIGFAIQVVVAVAVTLIGSQFGFSPIWGNLLTLPLWLFYAARRFHDLGLPGALGLIPIGGSFVLGVVVALARPDPELRGLIMGTVPLALTLGFVAWLGCARGQPEANEFGPPPGQEDAADVF